MGLVALRCVPPIPPAFGLATFSDEKGKIRLIAEAEPKKEGMVPTHLDEFSPSLPLASGTYRTESLTNAKC